LTSGVGSVIIRDMESKTKGAKQMSAYVLYTTENTGHRTTAKSPAAALRELCKMAGLTLESQNGRYGKTTDGQNVAAMTVNWNRAHYADHGTTRL
jgi:hypothetical protein